MERSKQDRGAEFNNLGHIIDINLLRECYRSLDGSKAVGIDKVTKDEYGIKLNENLNQLLLKIRRGSYHPKASRIVEIPKLDGSMRPLAISCTEDKIVQEAVKRVIESIYEPIFTNDSHGFRPNRSCDTALVALNDALYKSDCGSVLEIDLRKYFNTIPHKPLEDFLRLKIKDEKFLYLILKLLKSPIIDEEGKAIPNEIGSPQGSIISPVLANIYLHYVLDIWFIWINESKYGGSARMVRYADDGAFTFRSVKDAEEFLKVLADRFEKFGVTLHEDKTKIMISGRAAAMKMAQKKEKMPTFAFLGFLHVWGLSRNRNTGQMFWRVKRRTCPIRFRKKLAEIKKYIKENRHDKNIILSVKSKVIGYLNYFAINDNLSRAAKFICEVRRMLFKWLNRRSQKRSFDWERFNKVLLKLKFPNKIVVKNLFFNMSKRSSSASLC
jgi:group II intron reverse transcriptase/maturase